MSIKITTEFVSNRDWGPFQIICEDEDTGELIDFTGATIAIAINDADGCQRILATNGNGKISVPSTGVIEIFIPASETNVGPGTYGIGGYYQLNGFTPDLIGGSISVTEGFPKP